MTLACGDACCGRRGGSAGPLPPARRWCSCEGAPDPLISGSIEARERKGGAPGVDMVYWGGSELRVATVFLAGQWAGAEVPFTRSQSEQNMHLARVDDQKISNAQGVCLLAGDGLYLPQSGVQRVCDVAPPLWLLTGLFACESVGGRL